MFVQSVDQAPGCIHLVLDAGGWAGNPQGDGVRGPSRKHEKCSGIRAEKDARPNEEAGFGRLQRGSQAGQQFNRRCLLPCFGCHGGRRRKASKEKEEESGGKTQNPRYPSEWQCSKKGCFAPTTPESSLTSKSCGEEIRFREDGDRPVSGIG